MAEQTDWRPRVGVPWRSAVEEISRKRNRYESYLNAIRNAGGEPVEISLYLSDQELNQGAESLDAVLLPGSAADVEPNRYGRMRHPLTTDADARREYTDEKLLDHAFLEGKPVLAICYGTQLLNVYLGGTLVQDISSELNSHIDHDPEEDGGDPFHLVLIETVPSAEDADGRRLAAIAAQIRDQNGHAGRETGPPDRMTQATGLRVNSSHHQSIMEPARGLRVCAQAPDGIIEAVEWMENSPWVVGVQWHPERMPGDAFSEALFRTFVSQAAVKHRRSGEKPGR